jgi:uncharacterized NAD(P)/FAD-binding protein YdhS
LGNPKLRVVIVGGGFSGTVLAVQLLRRTPDLRVGIVDKASAPGRGLAYGTECRCHLLNVPAGNMSALPEEPDHFLNWARANYQGSVQARSFLPRALYGRYVGSLLEQAIASAGCGTFQWIQGEALSLTRSHSKVNVQLSDGRELPTEAVVLAMGNFPPANPKIPGLTECSERYVPFAWSATALEEIPKNGSALLIGSGLTSLDLAIGLKAKGFAGRIHILSRRGLIPQRHQQNRSWPQFWSERSPRTTLGLLRLIRQQARLASEAGVDWRAVVDALRPVTQRMWKSLPLDERRRFLRHLHSYWEVHRHRIAPEIADIIADLAQEGQVRLHAGRVTNYREHCDGAEVAFSDRRTGVQHLITVDRVINCTGSESDCRRIEDPLIMSLFAQGLARPDPLFLGLDVDEEGALLDCSRTPSQSLYAIGPARKGCLWETTAVPEIRTQASQLAEHLVSRLRKQTRYAGSTLSETAV